ncbi:MAG: MinD/ParA family protein [Proteobacteria bacterium]|nr:MinD/ParA family protein [Pseudomonadota bacterium]NOG58953.1 MinD/ParA family protein [Pseudomonadota bacterium]
MTLKNKQSTRVLAVTSGKGGVGKTNISINLALALAERDKSVTLMDADLGLANIDVLLNLKPLRNLSHVIEGECELKDIIIEGPDNIRIIPASSGIKMMSQLTSAQNAGLVHAFDELEESTDILIVDTSAGLSDSVIRFCSAAQEVFIVVCNDPASIADSYALIKTLHRDHKIQRFQVVVNKVKTEAEGCELFERLRSVSEQFLDVVLKLKVIIPQDENILRAVRQRRPFYTSYPDSKAIKSFKKFAAEVDNTNRSASANGRLTFFAKQMIGLQDSLPSRAII